MPIRPHQVVARLVLVAASCLLVTAEAAAQKVDVLLFKNGDRLTCEVRLLERGLLQVKTDSLSTVDIEWADLASVTADALFEVEMTTGAFHYGRLGPAQPGELVVSGDAGSVVVDMDGVFRITKLEIGFWRRLDGSVDLGGSYTQSSGVGQATIASELKSRRPGFEWRIGYDSSVTLQETGRETSSQNLQARYTQLLKNRWLIPGFGIFERNQELGFKLRSTVGAGLGRAIVQSNRTIFTAGAGLAFNREVPVDGEHNTNFEAVLFVSYDVFTYNFPKIDVRTQVSVYPSMSDAGRIRISSKAQFRRELFSSDVYAAFTVYDDYDNRPPGGAAKFSTNDLRFTFSFGVTF
ncbi:MAG TPA: DUF481 domain-containing protein [Vicinamibacterales bacterium]|nr:DUF481 domain-containing protein [Vicinamibacterales bacterium]